MEVVIATFKAQTDADAYRTALGERLALGPEAIGTATVAAYGEAYDGDRLVVAWMPASNWPIAIGMAERLDGTIHTPSRGTSADRSP